MVTKEVTILSHFLTIFLCACLLAVVHVFRDRLFYRCLDDHSVLFDPFGLIAHASHKKQPVYVLAVLVVLELLLYFNLLSCFLLQ
ncbi:hypothetical protein COF63_26330 [Bacillus pseudomycoides]|uniref:hypothetical protein n=1 Tax=Bacillus pseudomycoides TaxID=64104 RepID=UPI0009B90522|nr:hypothetical protein [Bacillus pseudomycoides]PEE06510.1 hypothetical protein CON86_09310 [Bacillus pseudomycoides]PEM76404.1 hypothetical protein CN632_13020 [Bacillus pseudomycoides]PHC80017.1 hypothetical protein COF63_26330 [Bacillus pseudomycoides]